MGYYFEITEDKVTEDIGGLPTRKGWTFGNVKVKQGKGERFALYDDDRILYYRGRLWVTDDAEEDDIYVVLKWGERDAGATELRFPNRPDWDMS